MSGISPVPSIRSFNVPSFSNVQATVKEGVTKTVFQAKTIFTDTYRQLANVETKKIIAAAVGLTVGFASSVCVVSYLRQSSAPFQPWNVCEQLPLTLNCHSSMTTCNALTTMCNMGDEFLISSNASVASLLNNASFTNEHATNRFLKSDETVDNLFTAYKWANEQSQRVMGETFTKSADLFANLQINKENSKEQLGKNIGAPAVQVEENIAKGEAHWEQFKVSAGKAIGEFSSLAQETLMLYVNSFYEKWNENKNNSASRLQTNKEAAAVHDLELRQFSSKVIDWVSEKGSDLYASVLKIWNTKKENSAAAQFENNTNATAFQAQKWQYTTMRIVSPTSLSV